MRMPSSLVSRVEGLETGVAKCYGLLLKIAQMKGGERPPLPMDELSQAGVSQIHVLLRKVFLLQQELKGAV